MEDQPTTPDQSIEQVVRHDPYLEIKAQIQADLAADLNQVLGGTMSQEDFNEKWSTNVVSERRRADELSMDPLLEGFCGRKLFFKELRRVILEDKRLQNANPNYKGSAVIHVDLDNFKAANDKGNGGHAFGDEVLRRVGKKIREIMRRRSDFFGHIILHQQLGEEQPDTPEGLAARPGGDELTACLFDTDLAGARLVTERVRAAIEEEFRGYEDMQGWIQTVSIGVTVIENGDGETSYDSPEKAMQRADIAGYRAKENGRNQVAVFGDDPNDLEKYHEWLKKQEQLKA